MAEIKPDVPVPDDFGAQLKPYRVRRKRLATFCLFVVITTIILGMQVYGTFSPLMTIGIIALLLHCLARRSRKQRNVKQQM